MSSLNVTLEIAKKTLLNSQVMIQTGSNNISNADNKAYARQRVLMGTNAPLHTYSGWLGMGAGITRVTQERDLFVERQLMNAIADESEYRTIAEHLDISAAYFSDDGDNGISTMLHEFWDAWDMLNQNPGLSERTGVHQAAQNLAGAIRNTHTDLQAAVDDLGEEVEDTVEEINTLLEKIHNYNEQIARAESPDAPANDLRDKRYEALRELSDLISIRYTENDNGAIDVTLDDSTVLVTGSPTGLHKLRYTSHEDGTFSISTTAGDDIASYAKAGTLDLEVQYQATFSGKLKGLLESISHTDTYLDRLDTFKTTLVAHVNTVYNDATAVPPGGPWPPAPPTPPWPAGAVFTEGDYMEVSSDFTPSSIDDTRALDMVNLQDVELTELGHNRLSDYLAEIQELIGLDQSNALSQGDFKEALRLQIETQQQSISGVSIDEELVEMLKYQQVYQAAAKMITQTADMINTVIEMV